MNISQLMEKMIVFSNGNLHDMNHLMCVWTYAKTIGELEGLDRKTQETLEIAAITHDIACPLCREKYGNTNGKRQEEEGGPLVRRQSQAQIGVVSAPICAFYHRSLGGFSIVSVQPCPLFSCSGSKLGQQIHYSPKGFCRMIYVLYAETAET